MYTRGVGVDGGGGVVDVDGGVDDVDDVDDVDGPCVGSCVGSSDGSVKLGLFCSVHPALLLALK